MIEAVLRMAVRGELWNGKKNDLARRLRLTKNFVSVGVDDLVSAGLLIRLSAVTERRGRPPISYQVSGEVRNDLKPLESPFSSLFDGLFLGVERSPGVSQQNGGELLIAAEIVLKKLKQGVLNRLLLAVLLDHANDVGLVVGVSRSDLQRMTGLNGDRVRNRLSILEELRLVMFHAPGFASARFPGGKVKSSFILSHDLLPSAKEQRVYETFSVGGGHFSSAKGSLSRQKGFKVSRESMLGVWLMLHRFISIALSTLRWTIRLEDKAAVGELIMSTLRADSPNKADGVDFELLCKDLAEWAVYLADHYIADYHINEEERVWILPYGKWEMDLIRWNSDESIA
ncbi:hypothetical protein IB234_11715 [Pseudomonas sp. PDM16]|uniref:hypothetical protein n=1 Tax=Pseudomonas sp. PDM16 TaxID=2769292 RepID=UPI00178226F5|nr:hypothetical protein [Pseudomonas sp. PDM16]MBD9415221.1 hypothetical protein [Pseudomonas sp. PDM16]